MKLNPYDILLLSKSSHALLAIGALSLFYFATKCLLDKSERRRPPGPPGSLIFGNALQIPSDHQWLKWHEWATTYGDLMRLKVFQSELLVVSSLKAAQDLLDSRGNIYSDRPRAVMAGELVGWGKGLGYSQGPPNARFRDFRRVFHQFMGPRACLSDIMKSAQELQNFKLLSGLLHDPGNFYEHCRTQAQSNKYSFTSSSILSLAYGYSPKDNKDHLGLVQIAEDAMAGFALASEPGRWWVDSVPILRYIPDWFPGASFKTAANGMKKELEKLYDIPYDFVKSSMALGESSPSFISSNMDEFGGDPLGEEFVKAAGASLYSGGAETTPSALTTFFLTMCLHPEIQVKAQRELDEYLQRDADSTAPFLERPARLACIPDRQSLPYIDALIHELWRWNPSVPLGLPHLLTQDDEYRGYFISKGTVVWANIWAILHDETLFPDSRTFKPERFIDHATGKLHAEQTDAVKAAFGFGRRICPGMYLAENAVFIAVATILSIFTISPKKGQKMPVVQYDGFISHPKPFQCDIVPRSSQLVAMLKEKMEEAS